MALIMPGQRLTGAMDAESLTALGQDLLAEIKSLESEMAPTFRAIEVWWRWYLATPRQKVKNFPFANSSNIVVPLIGITCDALTSRTLAQLAAGAPEYWSTRTEDESRVQFARNIKRYINWQADGNDFSIQHVLADALPEMYVTGRTVCAIHYRRDVRPFFFGRETAKGLRAKRIPMTFARGPLIEHVPREHVLWNTRCRIGDSPIVVRKREWTWVELRDMAKLDEAWDAEAVRAIRKSPGVADESESAAITQTKNELSLRDESLATDLAKHDIREVHVDWSMLGNQFEIPGEEEWSGEQVPLVAHIHYRTGTVLRLVGQPYMLPYKPFVDLRWRHGNFGVAKALEQMQEMQTTAVNQMFDAQTRANALWAITRNPKHAKTPFDPSRPLVVDDMGEFAPMNLGQSVQPTMAGLTIIQTMAERWMGHSDPLLGRDTRSGGHPAPATSTLALLEQVNMMSAGTDLILRKELSRLGEAVAILDQQFETDEGGKLQRVLGREDAESLNEWLFPDEPIPGNYIFNVNALSANENPDVEMRRTLQLAQAYQNYAALAVQAAQILDMPANRVGPRVKAVWSTLLDNYSVLLSNFLEAGNVDDSERFLVQLAQIGVDARNAYAQFTSEAQRSAMGGQGGPPNVGPGAVSAAGSVVGPGMGAGGGEGRPIAGVGLLQ